MYLREGNVNKELKNETNQCQESFQAPAALLRGKGLLVPIGWVSPKVDMDVFEKREIFCLRRESNPDPPVRSLVTVGWTV